MTYGPLIDGSVLSARRATWWPVGYAQPIHVCDLSHDCPTTTVNHRCHCGVEWPSTERPETIREATP